MYFFKKELHQKRNILQPFGERGNADLDGAEPIEQILAKAASQHFGAQIAVGGRNQAHVDLFDLRRADALDFPSLDHTQQLGLRR